MMRAFPPIGPNALARSRESATSRPFSFAARWSALPPLNVQILGIDLTKMQPSAHGVQLSSNAKANFATAKILGQSPVLLGRGLSEKINASKGPLDFFLDGRRVRLTPVGTIESAAGYEQAWDGQVVVMDRADLARLIDQPDRVSRIDIRLEDNANKQSVREQLSAIVAGAARIRSAESLMDRGGEMFAGLGAAFSLCGVGTIIAALLLIHNVLAVSVAERRHDFGVLKSLGATRTQILVAVCAEAAALGIVGGLAGLPLGHELARMAVGPIRGIVSEMLLPLGGIEIGFSTGLCVRGVAVAVVTSILVATIPAFHAARVDPVAALRRIDQSPDRGPGWKSFLPAAGAATAGAVIHLLARPTHSGTWASLFCLVMAMLFLAPQLTRLLALLVRRAARRGSAISATLALDNLLRWPKRYGFVVATLAGGIALLVQTGGIIRSNEEALRDWLDRSVIGDLFVTSGGPLNASGQNQPMSDELAADWSRRIPELRIVPMRFRYVDWQQGNRNARLLVVLLDAPKYRAVIEERFADLPDRELYRRLAEQPDAALVSRNFSARNGLTAGDTLTLPSAEGPKSFRILGTVADYSCIQGTVLLDRSRHSRAFGANLADVFSITAPAGFDIERVRSECLKGSATSLTILTHQEMRTHTLGMIQRLYGIAAAQLALVAIVSILGVAATMAISVLQRSNELKLFRCIGATRSQTIGLVLAEAFMIGLLGTAVGLLLGGLLEWFTIRVVLFAETGFVFAVVLPWRELLIVGLAAPACAIVAGLVPALTAARMNPAGGFATE